MNSTKVRKIGMYIMLASGIGLIFVAAVAPADQLETSDRIRYIFFGIGFIITGTALLIHLNKK